jgi:transcriptional regulator of aromatic amino acid metabolism
MASRVTFYQTSSSVPHGELFGGSVAEDSRRRIAGRNPVQRFGACCARRLGRQITHVPWDAIDRTHQSHWSGSIRELDNVIERAVSLSSRTVFALPHRLRPEHLRLAPRQVASRHSPIARRRA